MKYVVCRYKFKNKIGVVPIMLPNNSMTWNEYSKLFLQS